MTYERPEYEIQLLDVPRAIIPPQPIRAILKPVSTPVDDQLDQLIPYRLAFGYRKVGRTRPQLQPNLYTLEYTTNDCGHAVLIFCTRLQIGHN